MASDPPWGLARSPTLIDKRKRGDPCLLTLIFMLSLLRPLLPVSFTCICISSTVSDCACLLVAIRITGAALSGGLTVAAGLALTGADVPAMASSLGSVPVLGTVAKFTVGFPIVYHYLGAIRHSYWDNNPEELQTSKVTQLSYVHGGLAVAISAGLALISIAPL